jgi:transposase-like protein
VTLEEVVAAYRFAHVAEPERIAAAFIARITPPLTVPPSCPQCRAPLSEIAWLGGCPPHGDDNWRCTRCQHTWTTPPAGSTQ